MTEAEIRARLAEVENALFGKENYTDPRVTYVPNRRAREAYAAHIAGYIAAGEAREALIRERAQLHAMLPPTGMLSGQRLVINGTNRPLRFDSWDALDAPSPPPDDGYDPSDPYQRFAKEVGLAWK